MPDPVTLDIPHQLGRAEARHRMDAGVAKLAEWIPGGNVREHHWEGDVLCFTVEAMGQTVASRLEPFDDRVHAVVDLPPMLALFAAKIREKLERDGSKLLR